MGIWGCDELESQVLQPYSQLLTGRARARCGALWRLLVGLVCLIADPGPSRQAPRDTLSRTPRIEVQMDFPD